SYSENRFPLFGSMDENKNPAARAGFSSAKYSTRLRAEEARAAAIADHVAVRVHHRHARPVAARAADRNRARVGPVRYVARLNHIGRPIRIRDRAADDGAGGNAA